MKYIKSLESFYTQSYVNETNNIVDKYNWPPSPIDIHSLSLQEMSNMFGYIEWKKGIGDKIIVTNNFIKENITYMELPQLAKIKNPPSTFRIRCHKLAVVPILRLWEEWEKAGLLNRIEKWHGCHNARVQRKSINLLSNHAWGTAFDINKETNDLGQMPPAVGERGSVRELVPIANKLGFFWGGHFSKRLDGMHFELTTLGDRQIIL
jgi:hypothetical protein